ncbi:MAG TPA: DUF4097 family beta strand repeat-containing protein [Vicinamibacteria bacterium]|nr:DUF4097 family beta strand repeat-containing protein [Vicinamibacteria bacterium]
MRGSRILLLASILCLGASVETAYRVREQIGVGPFGWRLFGGRFYGPSYDFEETDTRELAAGMPVAIENAFGDVEVTAGGSDEVEVTLRKLVYLGSEEKARAFAQRVRLEAQVVEGRLRIATNRAELERESDAFDVGFETHLKVRVPPGAAVAVKGSHGRADVEGAGETRIENDFGDVRVSRVAELDIDSGHGTVEVLNAAAGVTAKVRFGDTSIRDAAGSVRLTSEHGEVSVERTGALSVEAKHGSVKAESVRGDLDVTAEHSAVTAGRVEGAARIATTFEDVSLEDVGGDARVRVEHGQAKCLRIKGALVAETSFGDAELDDVSGLVEVSVSHGGLRGARLRGGVKARAEGDDVVLDGFRGDVTAEAVRGSVKLVPEGALTTNVKASASFGGVDLRVPDGSRFALVAGVDRGELDVVVPGLQLTEASDERVNGRLGEGGGTVELQADHGSIRVGREERDLDKDAPSE